VKIIEPKRFSELQEFGVESKNMDLMAFKKWGPPNMSER